MVYEDRNISFSVKLPVVECDGCHQKFVLIAIFDQQDEQGEVKMQVWEQVRSCFCPYCGKKEDVK